MIRLLAAGACVTLLLGLARVPSVPIAIATLGIATVVLSWMARALAGHGAARAAAVLLVAFALPLLIEFSATATTPQTVLGRLSLIWLLPLVLCAWLVSPPARASLGAVLLWWAVTAVVALGWADAAGAVASLTEVGRAALLGGIAVPLLVAALLVVTTDVLTNEEPPRHEAVGAALLIAIIVLGVVPGAHALVQHRHALAAAAAGAEAPSRFEAP